MNDVLSAHDKYLYELEIQKLSQTAATALERLLTAEAVLDYLRDYLTESVRSPARKRLQQLLDAHDAGKPS